MPDNTVASVRKEYDLTGTPVRRWAHHAEIDAGVMPGATTGEAVEVARLRRQLRGATEGRYFCSGSGFVRPVRRTGSI